MVNLDQPQNFLECDKENMLRHIEDLPDQIAHAWEEMQKFVVPATYIQVKNVVILGMGGSGMGGTLLKYISQATSKVPVEVVKDYQLPKYVNSDTLVIGVSYSGQTEETVMAFNEAGKRKAKLMAVTTGGEIASLASRYKAPTYIINYGSQPRAALGYTFTPVLAVLSKLGIVDLGEEDIKETVLLMKGLQVKLAPDVPIYKNEAKKLAIRLENTIVYVIGSDAMAPVAYRWATMINENAKHYAIPLVLPEMCHNWLLGTEYPTDLKKSVSVVILESKHDFNRNRTRQQVIGQILNRKGVRYEVIPPAPSGSLLSEQMITLYLGDYVSYYMALLHQVNPTSIDEIDYLKKQLSRKPMEE